MSRTEKDIPYHVRTMKSGHIHHDHSCLGHTYRSIVKVNELSIVIPKADAKTLAQYREFLHNLGSEYFYEEKELPARIDYNIYADNDVIRPKSIEFAVYRERTQEVNPYCTDIAHYDARTGKDTRTGLRAECRPVVSQRQRHHCSYPSCGHPAPTSRERRRTALKSLAQVYNNSMDFDVLDDCTELTEWDVVEDKRPNNWARMC